MTITLAEILECTGCGKSTEDGLSLMPSGRNFKRHEGADGERCTGGNPQSKTPEPVELVSNKKTIGSCRECGEEAAPLVSKPGWVRKHTNPQTLEVCEQRESVKEDCPVCVTTRIMRHLRFPLHKDPVNKTRCPGSNKTMPEAQKLAKEGKKAPAAKIKPERPVVPRQRKEPNAYKALPPLEKSKFKAEKLGKELAEYPDPWRYRIEDGDDADQATLVLRRGRGNAQEEMRISWWAGACLGGDGRITHEYRNRTIAIRNANAIRLRARMTPDQVAAEFTKVGTRKTTPKPRVQKTEEQLKELLPFDPATVSDKELLRIVKNKTVTWINRTAGKQESDVVRGHARVSMTKSGVRNLDFTGQNTSRTVRVENLVAVS